LNYVKRTCQLCGAAYNACATPGKNGAFRWQDVCCCREHWMQYHDQIIASRNQKDNGQKNTEK
jgi:hypothetical protein